MFSRILLSFSYEISIKKPLFKEVCNELAIF